MERAGNGKGEFGVVAAALVAIGLGGLGVSVVPGVQSLLDLFWVSVQALRWWSVLCAVAGAAGLAILVSVAYIEARIGIGSGK